MTTPVQLSLAHIDMKADASLQDFNAPSFAAIVSAAHEFVQGKVRELYFFGNTGSGKTHLLSAIQKAYLSTHDMAIFLSLQEIIGTDVQALTGLEMFNLIIIDDIHLAANHPDWQIALFHLINRARSQKRQLIYSASGIPSELGLSLPDLVTRLSQVLSFGIAGGGSLADRRALLNAILKQKGWQLPESIHEHFVHEGPQYAGDMVAVLTAIAPYFSHRNRGKLPQKLIDEIKNAIKEQSLLVELADIELDNPASPDNHSLDLPMTYY